MKQTWLYIDKTFMEIERRQCRDEGRDLSMVEPEFQRVLGLDLEDATNQVAAKALLDLTIELPLEADYAFVEPDGLAEIRALRPTERVPLPQTPLSETELEDKVHGAWTGRCVGCLLGKPVEGWDRERMWGYLKAVNRWPLADFFRLDITPPEVREKYSVHGNTLLDASLADLVSYAPEDDDTNYTTAGLAILKKYGPGFTSEDVANFWLQEIPMLHTCTAERVAYRNFANLIPPPESAKFRNPYREWIGAQIRADFWGYAAAGNPQLAAEFAWRDASISHVKNGIYGEMWVAAMVAAAFVVEDVASIIRIGLGEIPSNCRLASAVGSVLQWYEDGVGYDEAVEAIHQQWSEFNPHDWGHTISNAMVVALGLLWGEGDFALTICRSVQACFDTDCNGATTGSIIGARNGRAALPVHWAGHINDTLHTGVSGYSVVKLEDMTLETMKIIDQVRTH
jgi:ADP-ribosylglycohydrolase